MKRPARWAGLVAALALLGFAAWPYVCLQRIDAALTSADTEALAGLVDLRAVRAEVKQRLGRNVDDSIGDRPGGLVGWLRNKVNTLGDRAVDTLVDMEWVRSALTQAPDERGDGPFVDHVSYAFFESYDRFLVRLGELGDDPVHVRLSLQGCIAGVEDGGRGCGWRITGIYY